MLFGGVVGKCCWEVLLGGHVALGLRGGDIGRCSGVVGRCSEVVGE